MWTEVDRRIYRREGNGYPSDLRNAEWARLAPLIPEASPGGRPRKTDMRAAMNAIFYLLRTGCPWHWLPLALAALGTGCPWHWLPLALAALGTGCPATAFRPAR